MVSFFSGPALLHIGYPKTATTYLQREIFSNADLGVGLALGEDNRKFLVDHFLSGNPYLFDPRGVAAQMETAEHPLRNVGLLPVWSEETFVGNFVARRYDGPWTLSKIAALQRPFRVLLTIRAQEAFALSAYREQMKLHRFTMTDFIGTGREEASYRPILEPRYLEYDVVHEHWATAFGAENILVLPMELLRKDAGVYFERLGDFLGIDLAKAGTSSVHNRGLGGTALAAARWLNAGFVRSPLAQRRSLGERLVSKTLRVIDRLAPEQSDTAVERKWREQIARRYDRLFSESNRRLSERTGLDLGELGYQVD